MKLAILSLAIRDVSGRVSVAIPSRRVKNGSRIIAKAELSHRIRNPLAGLSKAELFHRVDSFARTNGLEDIQDDLRKGALVAQNPGEYENIEEINDEERGVLRDEVEHIYKQPWTLYITVIIC